MGQITQNKWFWIAVAAIVPFIVITVAESLMVAIIVYIVVGGGALFFIYQLKEQRSKRDNPTVILENRGSSIGSGRDVCPKCDGNRRVRCDNCNGTGRKMNIINVTRCRKCNGSRELRCGLCRGRGLV